MQRGRAMRLVISGGGEPRAAAVMAAAGHAGFGLRGCRVARVYLLSTDPGGAAVARLVDAVLADPVTETAAVDPPLAGGAGTVVVEVGPLPGVTDVEARELEAAAARLGIEGLRVATATRYELEGDGLDEVVAARLATSVLANATVERFAVGGLDVEVT